MNKLTDLQILLQLFPNKHWDYINLWPSAREASINPNITYQFAQENSNKSWSYSHLSINPNITYQIIKENPDKPWSYGYLWPSAREASANPNITWDIVKENLDKPWNYWCLSANPNITFQIVQDNIDKSWSYNCLCPTGVATRLKKS